MVGITLILLGITLAGKQIGYVVKAVEQAMLLVRINIKMLPPARRQVSDGLLRQIHPQFSFGIGMYRVEKLTKEILAHHYRENEII